MNRILVLISYEYLNIKAVHDSLSKEKDSNFLLGTRVGIGHQLLANHNGYNLEYVNWKPSWSLTAKSANTPEVDKALIFWDGQDPLPQTSVRFFEKRAIPFTIVSTDGKVITAEAFHGRFKEKDVATPQVIVDKAPEPQTYGKPSSNETKVRLTITIPESIVSRYESQAKAVALPVEKVLSDRLRACVDHTSGRGLYFNDAERSHLERITGGHIIPNTAIALDKIRTVVSLKVDDVTIELSERILARCASRAKSERKSFSDYVKKEVIQGLERVVGLRPW